MKKLTAEKYLIVCALPETEDYINLFILSRRSLSISPKNLWKPRVFHNFRWLEKKKKWPEMIHGYTEGFVKCMK